MVRLALMTLAVAAAITAVTTPLAVRLALRIGAVDEPGPRKIHNRSIPRIGGLAVYLGVVGGLVFAALATGFLFRIPERGFVWGSIALSATILFLVGLVDDIVGVAFQWKFLAQFSAAMIAWVGGFRIETLSHPFGAQPLHLAWLSLPVTILWIVAVTNAINLIDGLDGLAAGTALITTLAVAVIAFVRDQIAVTAVCVALVGSLLAFLRFNFNPARIFLGDSGSLFLGFVLAVLSIHGNQKGSTAVAALGPVLVLGFPIVDTCVAIVRRLNRLGLEGLRNGAGPFHVIRNLRQVFLPDRGHLHHRLLDLGMSHRGAVLTLYAVVAILAIAALVSIKTNSVGLALLLVAAAAVSVATLLAATILRVQRAARRGAAEARGRSGGSRLAPGSPPLH